MLLLVALLACDRTPTSTDGSGMVARVLDAKGAPMPGLSVRTLEADHATDGDGKFALRYKAPDQYVFFDVSGVMFQREYAPADDGKVLDISVPALADVPVSCGVGCDVEARWDFGGGLTARKTFTCAPDTGHLTLPATLPTLKCTKAGADVPVVARIDGSSLVIGPPPTPIRVEVRAEEGALPDDCLVIVGGQVARADGPGFFVGEADGRTVIRAICGGQPSLPVVASAGDASAVVEWSANGPALEVHALPLVHDATLVLDDSNGWMLPLLAGPDGRFRLPPLPHGHYRVVVGDPGSLVATPTPDASPPGVLNVLGTEPADDTRPGGLVGTLWLDSDLAEGLIPVVSRQ